MLLKDEREQVVLYGQKLITSKLTTGTGGNLSVYNKEKGLMAIKPSGMEYFSITPEDVVVMDLEGNIVEGSRTPSSEYTMHKVFYERRDDIGAVVHTHSPFATTISCLGIALPAVHYLIAFSGGHKVDCTPYVPFGSHELAELAYEYMNERYAVILGNHGLLTGGPDMDYAFSAMEEIEFCAELYCRTEAIGEPNILSKEEIDVVLKKFSTYGQKQK